MKILIISELQKLYSYGISQCVETYVFILEMIKLDLFY